MPPQNWVTYFLTALPVTAIGAGLFWLGGLDTKVTVTSSAVSDHARRLQAVEAMAVRTQVGIENIEKAMGVKPPTESELRHARQKMLGAMPDVVQKQEQEEQ